ncbi:MAG: hypothetical protein U0835_12840 [Isosphaeraceae bacterium]
MAQFKTIRRVTVYADGALEQTILNLCTRFGARGYTVLAIREGKGLRTAAAGKFGTPQSIRIELLVDPEVAQKILMALSSETFGPRPVLACSEPVEVAEGAAY